MREKRTWFKHTCWFCGLRSRDVDLIVGDGVYQCHFENRADCEARHRQLDAVALARLPKPYSDPRRDWSVEARVRAAELEVILNESAAPKVAEVEEEPPTPFKPSALSRPSSLAENPDSSGV